MTHNDILAKWLHSKSIVPPNALKQALDLSNKQGRNLCDVLIEQGLIQPEWRESITKAALQTHASGLTVQSGSQNSSATHPLPPQTKTPIQPSASLEPGEIQLPGYEGIERYVILGEIGRGGMGRVYKARVRETGAEVVVKTLLKLKKDEKGKRQLERFRREGIALAQLNHHNIVRVFDFRMSGQSAAGRHVYPYLVMEHIEGQTLEKFYRNLHRHGDSSIDLDTLDRLFLPLAEALTYCHEKGLVHRDVKPANVLIEGEDAASWRPVLLDFGLVKMDPDKLRESLEMSEALTKAGQTIGSPAFAAPEQLHGHTAKFGPPMDVWGFGATLYWCVSGQLPYAAKGLAELYAASRKRDPHRLSSHDPKVPVWLDELCALCLQRDPDDRPPMAVVHEVFKRKKLKGSSSFKLNPLVLVAFFLSALIVGLAIKLFQIDREKPTLSLKSEQSVTRGRRFKVSGQVSDESPGTVLVKKKGMKERAQEYPVAEDGQFTVELKLEEGKNTFILIARDKSGNKSDPKTVKIWRDSVSPDLDLDPTPKSTHEETLKIAGRYSKDSVLKIGDKVFPAGAGVVDASVALEEGWNTIAISVTDAVGNETKQVLKVERLPVFRVFPKDHPDSPRASFQSIGLALAKAPPRARILVHPGLYTETFEITKQVILEGVGPRENVVLRTLGASIKVRGPKVHISGLTVKSKSKMATDSQALNILANDCLIENCVISSVMKQGINIGVGIVEEQSRAFIGLRVKSSVIQNCGLAGFNITAGSEVQFIDCVFQKNKDTGVMVLKGSVASFEGCRFENNGTGIGGNQKAKIKVKRSLFFDNRGEAVWVENKSTADLKDCTIARNGRWRGTIQRPGLNAMVDSVLTAESCVVKDGYGVGVLAQDKGQLILKNSQILNQRSAGIAAQRNGVVIHQKCLIDGNKAGSFYKISGGRIEAR